MYIYALLMRICNKEALSARTTKNGKNYVENKKNSDRTAILQHKRQQEVTRTQKANA